MNQCILPVPPSANQMWRVGGGRVYKSRPYAMWQVEATQAIIEQGPYDSIPERAIYCVEIAAVINHRRDIDNLGKPTLDTLSKVGVVPDDRWANRVLLSRQPVGYRGLAEGQMLVSWADCPQRRKR